MPADPDRNRLRLAVFDCDGTLVDSAGAIVASMADAFGLHGLPAPDDVAVRRVIGLTLEEAVGRLAPDIDEGGRGVVSEAYKASFRERRECGGVEEDLYPGAAEVLDALDSAGWLLGIATGKARRGLEATLGRHGLLERFVTTQTADVAPGKPHPGMLERAMAETGAAPADTVMIGDTTFDMEMARNAGAIGIGVAWGYHAEEELHAAGARHVVDVFHLLPRVLTELTEADR